MTLVVDIRHWLDDAGDLLDDNLPLRRRALHIARLIEAGGPLAVGELRETLVECTTRRNRKPCPGLLWVEKQRDDRISAYCVICAVEHAVISGWQATRWARGPKPPLRRTDHASRPPE